MVVFANILLFVVGAIVGALLYGAASMVAPFELEPLHALWCALGGGCFLLACVHVAGAFSDGP